MLHIHPGNQVALFEIAATLIPLLLFGGVVAERVGPRDGYDARTLLMLGLLVAFVGGYAILAEAVAITVVVTGEPTLFAEIFTLVFLIGGMIGVVVALIQPWYAKLKKTAVSRAKVLQQLAALALMSVAVLVLIGLLNSLHRAGEGEFSEARLAVITQKTTEEAAVRSRILALLLAVGRIEQQETVARTRHEAAAVFHGYQAELSALRARLVAERKNDQELVTAIIRLRHLQYGT